MMVNLERDELLRLLLHLEVHAALTQAIAAITSTVIAAGALIYAVRSLRAVQRQADASIALTTETFRPIVVLGGALGEKPAPSHINFVNKGNGAALNFRWRVDEAPERWGGYKSNMIAPQEMVKSWHPWTGERGWCSRTTLWLTERRLELTSSSYQPALSSTTTTCARGQLSLAWDGRLRIQS